MPVLFSAIAKRVLSFEIRKTSNENRISFELNGMDYLVKENSFDLYAYTRSGREELVEKFDSFFALNGYINTISSYKHDTSANQSILEFLMNLEGFKNLEFFTEKKSYYVCARGNYFYFKEIRRNFFEVNSNTHMTLFQLKDYIQDLD